MKTGKEMAADIFAEMERRQNEMNNRKKRSVYKIVPVTVLLLALLSSGAFAMIRFVIPHGLEDAVGNELVNVLVVTDKDEIPESVQVLHKTVESNGYIITLEALAEGAALRTVFTKDPGDTEYTRIERQDLFAVVSIRKTDGEPVILQTATDFGYVICLDGYAPNQSMFEYYPGFYTAEDGTLYMACSVTDAKVFAGEQLWLAVFEDWPTTPETLRMEESGKPVFTEYYKGIRALFELPIPVKYADRSAAEEKKQGECFQTDPDYRESDQIIAKDIAFAESGIDLRPYIGSHLWRGSYALQFGEVEFAQVYKEHRNDWKKSGLRLLTAAETAEAADLAVQALSEKYDLDALCAEDYDLSMQYLAEAAFKPDYFPADASFFTLPDGSKALYVSCGAFVHLRCDGTAGLVYAPCEQVVVECDGIDVFYNLSGLTYTGLTDSGHCAANPTTVAGWYLEKIGFDRAYPTFAGGDIDLFERSCHEILTGFGDDTDAIYTIASAFYAYPGVIDVAR